MKLTSPNYPDLYDPLTDCKWNLTTDPGQYITLDFERIDVSRYNVSCIVKCKYFIFQISKHKFNGSKVSLIQFK